jgi:hypothetical protein
MNIVKLQSQLQKVPDQALIGYVQNPDGQVPSYLALAELTRRKEMRNSAAPQQPAPTQTVADQTIAETQPMQGVAALPVPEQMFNPESYASGGIVAFEDGGEVKRFDGRTGSFVARPMGDAVLPLMGSSGDLLSRIEELKRSNPWMSEQQLKAQIAAEATVPQMPAVQQKMFEGRPAPTPLNYDRPAPQQIMSQVAQRDRITSDIDAPRPASVGSPLGIGALAYKPYQTDTAGFDALMPEQRSMRDYAAEFKDELGDDPGRAAMKKNLAKMRATGEKEAERAPWMALAEAGLGMAAGRSQFALQNIAEGGKQGLKAFAESRDNLRKAEERRFELESKVAQAERAEQLASINYGADSKRADDQNRRAIGLAKQADLAREKEVNARMEYESKKDAIEFKLKEREINAMDKRIDRQIAATENQSIRAELTHKRDTLKTAITQAEKELENETKALNPDPAVIAKLRATVDTYRNALYNMSMQPSLGASSDKGALDPAGLKAFDRPNKK